MKESLDPNRWQLLDRVFQHAADLPPAERSAYLDQACHGDAALRTEVDRLLAGLVMAGGQVPR